VDPEDETIETEEASSYVEQQAADFVLFCDALEIDTRPDDSLSCR